jgi:hypothetical protein
MVFRQAKASTENKQNRAIRGKKTLNKHLQFDSSSVATWHRWVEQTVQLVPAWKADEPVCQTKAAV